MTAHRWAPITGATIAIIALFTAGIFGIVRGAVAHGDRTARHRNLADCHVSPSGAWDAHA